MQGVEGVFKKERDEAVRPGVRPENVKDLEVRAGVADPGEELELEVGSAVQLALDVVLERKFGEAVKFLQKKKNTLLTKRKKTRM